MEEAREVNKRERRHIRARHLDAEDILGEALGAARADPHLLLRHLDEPGEVLAPESRTLKRPGGAGIFLVRESNADIDALLARLAEDQLRREAGAEVALDG